MSLATEVVKLTTKVNDFMDLVKGQYSKWDGEVKVKIAELKSWKEDYLNAGYGLKKYKNYIGHRPNFYKAVIPLVELDNTNIGAFSYTSGRFDLIRTNGCCIQSSVLIDIKAIKIYNSEDFDLFVINLDSDHVKNVNLCTMENYMVGYMFFTMYSRMDCFLMDIQM